MLSMQIRQSLVRNFLESAQVMENTATDIATDIAPAIAFLSGCQITKSSQNFSGIPKMEITDAKMNDSTATKSGKALFSSLHCSLQARGAYAMTFVSIIFFLFPFKELSAMR